MAKDRDDRGYWLLPQFLVGTDDDLFAEFRNSSKKNGGTNNCNSFGMDFKHDFGYGLGDSGSFGPQSDLGSPFEGSTETESDDDDYVTELTRKFAHSSLHESPFAFESKMGWPLSGSPESTLSGALGGGCGCNHCSSRGSPTGPSQVTSPTRMNRNDTSWDLLHAAAGEVARLRMVEEAVGFHRSSKNGGLVGPPRKPSPISVPQRSPSQNPTHLSFEQHLKALRFQLLRQQQMSQAKFQMSQTQQIVLNRGRKLNASMGAWPTLEQTQRQQEAGSRMRAVFLGNHGSKRECVGTGVFLPRGTGAPAAPRKKPACSTVLLPDRVVQALNLKLEAVDTPDHEAAAVGCRSGVAMAQQRRSVRHHPAVMNQPQELQLPQEWTY